MDKSAQEASKINLGLRRVFSKEVTRPYASRIRVLNSLKRSFMSREAEVISAISQDLHRNEFDTRFVDIGQVKNNVEDAIGQLKDWMKNESRDTPFIMVPGSTYLKNDPYGVALVIGAWNFPFATTLLPVISAIAAGNCVCIKPSEVASECSKVINAIIRDMKEESVVCVEGGTDVIVALLNERWDVIAFTGSPEKGKLVAAAAAKHLTPTILELGGKNTVIVDRDVDMNLARNRIMQGRFLNCGQLCISPDIAYVHESRVKEFLDACKRTIFEFFGENPKESPDLGRIINDMQHRRVSGLLENHGGEVIVGGDTDASLNYVAPTIILNPSLESEIMKEEIFGPILLVRSFNNYEEVKNFVNEREKPLVLYYFGKKRSGFNYFADGTSSGGLVWNDTLMHYGCSDLAFGGVGNSGMSKIMGKQGYHAFTHRKGVLEAGTFNGYPMTCRYPPHTASNAKVFFTLSKYLSFPFSKFASLTKKLAIIGVTAVAAKYGYLDPIIKPAQKFAVSLFTKNN